MASQDETRDGSAKSIFLDLLEIASAGDRLAYLDRRCGADRALRAEVEALLVHHDRLEGYLERPALDREVTQDEPSRTPVEGPGTLIGPYKLLEQIGEGGMGQVYMAEQTRPVRRRVALKIIKPGMDTRQVVARFEAERQALALMDHSNIAKVLDAGATESGRPFFIMELVRGIPITEYCDQAQLPISDRLGLFVQVCQAVQHAHQKGVIHRDLKPSNVLVTLHDGVPVPKVIDFGIAKATGQQLTEKTLFTGFAQLVGTPLYMSPEQAEMSGLDVDTRSDIYSLGVLLYELLTGTTPFDRDTLRKAAFDEVRRMIREDEPPTPSTRLIALGQTLTTVSAKRGTDPRHLGRAVRGELDWIVMKALEKDRNRRYETANGLAADVRRYLDDEPVQACPPSAWYGFSKLARRNRVALVTSALVASALVLGSAVSTWQAIRATRAEEQARKGLKAERTARSEASRLLGEVTQERNGAHLARQEADRRASEAREVVDFLINDLIGAATPSQAQGKIPTLDQVLARADERIGKKFADRPLIEASIRDALGKAYEDLGQFEKAEQHAARSVKLRLAHLGPNHAETIAAQNALSWDLLRQSKNEDARTLLIPVLETARKALGLDHVETLRTMHGLAAALFQLGKNDEARALDEELLPIRKRVLGPEHPETLATINSLANTWRHDGNVEKAKPLYEQVLTFELRDQPDHPRTFVTMDNLAYIYRFLEQNDRATEMRRRIMEGRVRVLGMAHPFTLHSIGDYFDSAQTDHRNWEEARSVLEQLLNRSRRELEPDSEAIASLTGWLANTLVLLDRIDQAVSLVDGLPENRQALGARDDLACFLYSCEARDAALVQFQRVEALRPRLVPADDPDGLVFRTRLALVLREHGRFAEARCVLEQTLAEAHRLREKAAQPNAEIEMMRGIAQLLLGRWPGLAPGVSPEQRPAASFAIDAPFRTTSLVADGRIAPGEYGPGVEATFDGDTNPGRLYLWYKSRSKTPDDLSVRVYSAHNDRSLFLAFLVRDQFVDAGEIDAKSPQWNDAVEVYINGDSVANDLTTVLLPSGTAHGTAGNREGFQLIADAGGHQRTGTTAFTNADWKVGTSRTADGYIIEFEIPLALIDTRDGPEYAPATGGDELRVNFGFVDVDAARSTQTDYGIFWAEDPALSPFFGGEDFWTVGLRLVPKPAKSQ